MEGNNFINYEMEIIRQYGVIVLLDNILYIKYRFWLSKRDINIIFYRYSFYDIIFRERKDCR